MTTLRRLRSLVVPKTRIKRDPGPSPQPILLKLTQLRVNDAYQRQLSKDSSQMATKIAVEFDWELYHLLVVSPLDEVDDLTGLPLYEIMDGQHTSIGALTNGHIKEVWCWPGRKDETLKSRASSFHKLNTQRTQVTNVQLFWADVTAGKEEALKVVTACERSGASVVKRPKPYGDMRIGETICTAPLLALAKKGGIPHVERVLKLCMNLRLAPIGQAWIQALTELTLKPHGPHFIEGNPADVDLAIENAVERLGVDEIFRFAKTMNASASVRDRYPVYWLIAHYIKKEIMSHATGAK